MQDQILLLTGIVILFCNFTTVSQKAQFKCIYEVQFDEKIDSTLQVLTGLEMHSEQEHLVANGLCLSRDMREVPVLRQLILFK